MYRRHHALTQSGFGSSAFTSPNPDRHYAPDLGLEPTHRDISLRVDLDAQVAEGAVTTTVICRRGGAERVKLDATDFNDVEVASPDGQRLDWHYDGEAIYASQVLAAMESQAFVEPDIDKLIDVGVSFIPKDSVIYRMISDIREWHAAPPGWIRTARTRGPAGSVAGTCSRAPCG